MFVNRSRPSSLLHHRNASLTVFIATKLASLASREPGWLIQLYATPGVASGLVELGPSEVVDWPGPLQLWNDLVSFYNVSGLRPNWLGYHASVDARQQNAKGSGAEVRKGECRSLSEGKCILEILTVMCVPVTTLANEMFGFAER